MVQCESEVKRLMAISNQKREFERKQQIIQNALQEVDKKPNNKIKFDLDQFDCEPEVKKKKKDRNPKTVLFDSDDEDIELTGHEFDNKKNLDGELIKLQSKYGNDNRFILDKRFIENDEENNESNNEEVKEGDDEKTFNLKMLENVLGKPILNKSVQNDVHKKSTESKFKPMVRYDPDDESHTKYELKVEKPEPEKKKERKIKQPVEETNKPPPVSSEITYSVSEKFTESWKKEEEKGISLLKMFGRNTEENNGSIDNSKHEAIDIEQKRKYEFDPKNPFKYDSSDDENDDKLNEYFAKRQDEVVTFSNEDNFFFDKDDPRLLSLNKDVFLRPQKEEVNFNDRRRELKRIIKKKIKNIQRDSNKWNVNKSWKSNEKRRKQ